MSNQRAALPTDVQSNELMVVMSALPEKDRASTTDKYHVAAILRTLIDAKRGRASLARIDNAIQNLGYLEQDLHVALPTTLKYLDGARQAIRPYGDGDHAVATGGYDPFYDDLSDALSRLTGETVSWEPHGILFVELPNGFTARLCDDDDTWAGSFDDAEGEPIDDEIGIVSKVKASSRNAKAVAKGLFDAITKGLTATLANRGHQ